MSEKILLIGSGGREHALAKALVESASCSSLQCVPGNPGIAELCPIVDIDYMDFALLSAYCRKQGITLVVIGPEQPLELGIADALRSEGIAVFGPSAKAARIETSKEFAKHLMEAHGIPTASFKSFKNDQIDEAKEYVSTHSLPVVIKASGLAAGKGVVIAETSQDAVNTVESIFGGEFGASGSTIVVEEFMLGEEASLFVVTDGSDYCVLAPAQDHKRIGDGDTGKNTGGMGAYTPAPLVTPNVQRWAEENIIQPTLKALYDDGSHFVGCLFVGLMVSPDGTSKVVEFNCRFGDPETQAVLSVLRADVARLFSSVAHGKLDMGAIRSVAEGYACCVILASGGYPDTYSKGFPISGLPNAIGSKGIVYHSGTALVDGKLLTSGGRVLGVTGLGATLAESVKNAYSLNDEIQFENKVYRTDIGVKGLSR